MVVGVTLVNGCLDLLSKIQMKTKYRAIPWGSGVKCNHLIKYNFLKITLKRFSLFTGMLIFCNSKFFLFLMHFFRQRQKNEWIHSQTEANS